MFAAAEELRFEYAAKLRDEIKDPRELDASSACRRATPPTQGRPGTPRYPAWATPRR